jgi:hypothetical protein
MTRSGSAITGHRTFRRHRSASTRHAPFDDLQFRHDAVRDDRDVLAICLNSDRSPVGFDHVSFDVGAKRNAVTYLERRLDADGDAGEDVRQRVLQCQAEDDVPHVELRTVRMDVAEWRCKTVFKTDDNGACRGRLTVSFAAGRDGEGDPEISEDGRRVLLEQFQRLTPVHVRAICAAARVEQLDRPRTEPSRVAGVTALDEWVAALEDKLCQIEMRHCQPAP